MNHSSTISHRNSGKRVTTCWSAFLVAWFTWNVLDANVFVKRITTNRRLAAACFGWPWLLVIWLGLAVVQIHGMIIMLLCMNMNSTSASNMSMSCARCHERWLSDDITSEMYRIYCAHFHVLARLLCKLGRSRVSMKCFAVTKRACITALQSLIT